MNILKLLIIISLTGCAVNGKFTVVEYPPDVLDANSGFTYILQDPFLRSFFMRELEANNRPLMMKFKEGK